VQVECTRPSFCVQRDVCIDVSVEFGESSKIVSVSVSQVKSAGATESALPLLAGPRSEHLFLAGRGAAPDLEQLLLPEGAQRPCTAEHLWSCSGCCGVCEAQEWPPVRLSAGAAGWPTHGFRSRALQAAAPQLIFRVKTLRDRVERALNFELVLWV
jgi:hypothetical protein